MALMLLESFQKYSFTQDARTQLSRYDWGSLSGVFISNVIYETFIPTNGGSFFGTISNFGRPGKAALGLTGLTNQVYISYGGQNSQGLSFDDEVTIGFSLYNIVPGGDPATYLASDDNHFEIYDANTISSSMMHVSVGQSRANNNLLIKYNNGASINIVPNGQTYNSSTYYEIGVKLNTGSGGIIKVRRNGSEICNITGVQTANSLYSGSIGYIKLGFPSRTHGLSVAKILSDIYIKNDLDFLGEIRVDALYPSANGTHTQFSANGSQSNHWDNVNEIFPDDNVTYNYAETGSNLNEDYTIQSIPTAPNVNTILGIQVTDTLKKSDVGSASIKSYLYNKITDTYSYFPTIDGAIYPPLSTSYSSYRFVANTDPFTTIQWTKESLANVQFGYNVP